MSRFLNIDCFVPRNDGVWIASQARNDGNVPRNEGGMYRHCEPAKQSDKNTQFSIFNFQFSTQTLFLIITLLLFGLTGKVMAQEIRLDGNDSRNRETVSVRLYDNNEGNYLLELPLTFHITPNNILFMIVGDNNGINGNNMIWMFDQTISLSDFQKKNKHIGAAKTFKKQIARLESFFDQSENVEKYTWFDNGFEQVQASPKPVFFKVGDTSKPVVLKLKFYTSLVKNNSPTELSSEAGIVKITINLLEIKN